MKSRLWLAMALAAVSVRLVAEGLPPQQRFVVEANSIRLDLTAIDGKGVPVTDLAESELLLTVGKEPRSIRVLRWLGAGRVAPAVPGTPATPGKALESPRESLKPPFGSNTGEVESHTWFIVVNHESLRPGDEYSATKTLNQLVAQLPARDRVGVATIPRGQALAEFTVDRDVVKKAIGLTSGHRSPPRYGGGAAAANGASSCSNAEGRVVISDLAAMFDALADMPGPKTLVFVSGTFVSITDPECMQVRDQLIRSAKASGAFLQVIEPHQFRIDAMVRGVDAWSGFDSMGASAFTSSPALEDLAGALGGDLFRLTGTGERLLDQLKRIPEGRYELYFDAEPDERNGTLRDFKVTTTRPGVRILARQFYSANAAKSALTASAEQLVTDGRIHTGVQVRLAAYPFRNGQSKDVKVIVVAEGDIGSAPPKHTSFALLDAKRKIVGVWSELPRDASGHVVTATNAKTDTKYARAAFVTADGRAGSAEFEFTAGLQQCGGASLSGIMTGRVAGSAFVPSLRVGDEALAYVELYAAAGKTPAVTFTVDDGAPTVANLTRTSEPDRWIVTGALPASLSPGDHTITATVLGGSTEMCRTTGVFRKGDS